MNKSLYASEEEKLKTQERLKEHHKNSIEYEKNIAKSKVLRQAIEDLLKRYETKCSSGATCHSFNALMCKGHAWLNYFEAYGSPGYYKHALEVYQEGLLLVEKWIRESKDA